MSDVTRPVAVGHLYDTPMGLGQTGNGSKNRMVFVVRTSKLTRVTNWSRLGIGGAGC